MEARLVSAGRAGLGPASLGSPRGRAVHSIYVRIGATAGLTLALEFKTLLLLDWLVADGVQGVVLGPTLAIPVRLPQPARLAWHKLWTAAQPDREVAKAAKDLTQGLILASALAEDDPQALADALQSLPARARQLALRRLRPELPRVAGHPRAMAVLGDLVGVRG